MECFAGSTFAGPTPFVQLWMLLAWAALRRRFLDFDWMCPWIAALSAVGSPGADVVLSCISSKCDKFQLRIAEYKDCLKFIRQSL